MERGIPVVERVDESVNTRFQRQVTQRTVRCDLLLGGGGAAMLPQESIEELRGWAGLIVSGVAIRSWIGSVKAASEGRLKFALACWLVSAVVLFLRIWLGDAFETRTKKWRATGIFLPVSVLAIGGTWFWS